LKGANEVKQKGKREKIGWMKLVLIDITAAAAMIAGTIALIRLMLWRFYEKNVPLDERRREEMEARREELEARA
jgi:hypothetical protein